MTDTAPQARPASPPADAASKPAASKPTRKPIDAAKLAQEAAQSVEGQDINPYSLTDPLAAAKWLLSRGWIPQGSPHFQFTKWLDPEGPTKDSYHKVVRTAEHIDRWDEKEKRYLTKIAPIMVKDRHGRSVECEQTVFTPKREPMSLDRALDIQLAREQAELTQAATAANAAVA